ncbi:hypothetical protein DZC30_01155 [Comamonas testosteroni]|uniref:Uncharacterized protein n=1 Tax=Comamonas testosteroni TaxID=285 RepID=A0A373FS94_COMTE|nr:hypothetical protein [Comamonas testosteroni]RGE47041.1 hypothetical protein DZC30_01155 [Comamonas testosteroni]
MGIQDRDYLRDWKRAQEAGRIDPTHWREDELNQGSSGQTFTARNSTNFGSEDILRFWSWVLGLAVIVAALTLGFRAWQEHRALKQLEAIAQQAAEQMREQQLIASQIAHQQALKNEQKNQAELERAKALGDALAAQDRTAVLEKQYQARKAAAWESYYKPSAACQRDPATVDCANEHIRARRAFDAQFKGHCAENGVNWSPYRSLIKHKIHRIY